MQRPSAEAAPRFREHVRALLVSELPPGWAGPVGFDADQLEHLAVSWRRRLHEHGLLAVTWPKAYGGAGLGPVERFVVAEELARAGVPPGVPNDLLGVGMLGDTLLAWGTEEQRARLLPRILAGTDRWCEGFSEPGAGSDLAGLACRATLDGDVWVINGQKVWTSYAHTATHIFLLARTNPDVPPHRGITFLLVPMQQPGVEVRRLRNLTGAGEFSEVFFRDAICGKHDVVGGVDDGWRVAMTLLQHERGNLVVTNYVRHRAELDRLCELARRLGRAREPSVRQRLASCHITVEMMRFQGLRALTTLVNGNHIGDESAMYKLFATEYHAELAALALDVLGPRATVVEGQLPISVFGPDPAGHIETSGSWIGTAYNAVAGTIYAGTSEIQRTILAERVLGLPKEPRA